MHLIVTIDTEEEGLWSGRYRRTGNSVNNVRSAARFQKLCDRFAVKPTYLVDAPVVSDAEAVKLLRGFQEADRAEIGAHVHPWCNPPLEEQPNGRNSFLDNLPQSLQRQKIEWLTDAIERAFSKRPTSFRAGRYGLGANGFRFLSELNYVVDSSVIPFTDYSAEGGPDFTAAPHDPYFPAPQNLSLQGEPGPTLEVPVTLGFNRVAFRRAHSIRRFVEKSPLRRLRCVGILDRFGIVRRIKLSPEQADVSQMKQLVNVRLRQKAKCVVMMFHSSSLSPGCSPYVPDELALDRFYDRLTQTFEYCAELGCESCSLSEFARLYSADRIR